MSTGNELPEEEWPDECVWCDKPLEGPKTDDRDILCPECRDDFNAQCDGVNDPVELALGAHLGMKLDDEHTICMCGKSYDGGPAYHRRHVAVEVYRALELKFIKPWSFGPLSESPNHPVFLERPDD